MKINLQDVKWQYNRRKKKYLYCHHPVGVNLMRLMATKTSTSSHSVKMRQRKTELNGSSYGVTGRYSIRSAARKAIATGSRRKFRYMN